MIQKAQKVRDRLWVQWNGRLYSVPADLTKTRGQAGSDEASELTAPFTCKVLKVQVKAGQEVKKGDPMIVVEAMKMEYAYSSPRDGTIEKVNVKEGDIVSQGSHFVDWKPNG